MLRAAATDVGRLYKRQLVDLLDVREGHTVLDAGCGPGTDLPTLAERVGATGTVVGVDRDPAMLAQARERTRELRRVEIREGDVLDLPVDRGTVDRAKIDRVLMHVDDPAAALAQLPDDQRTAVIKKHFHGESLAAIAAEMDRSTLAVAGLLKRGLKKLRTLMDDPEASGA